MFRNGAGPQGQELVSLDPIKRRFAVVINANPIAMSALEYEQAEGLYLLYDELQRQEVFLDHLEEALARLAQAFAVLVQNLQIFLQLEI